MSCGQPTRAKEDNWSRTMSAMNAAIQVALLMSIISSMDFSMELRREGATFELAMRVVASGGVGWAFRRGEACANGVWRVAVQMEHGGWRVEGDAVPNRFRNSETRKCFIPSNPATEERRC